MRKEARVVRRWLFAVVVVPLAACSGGSRPEPAAAPPPAQTAEPAGGPAVVPAAPGSKAFEAVIRQKIGDNDYVSAIADLEGSSGAKDAGEDLAAGRRRLLALPSGGGGSSRIVGVNVSRDKLPEDVRIVRIAGWNEGTDNKHAIRFQLLCERYVKDYNSTMVRGIGL
jgi:hypothetical protein